MLWIQRDYELWLLKKSCNTFVNQASNVLTMLLWGMQPNRIATDTTACPGHASGLWNFLSIICRIAIKLGVLSCQMVCKWALYWSYSFVWKQHSDYKRFLHSLSVLVAETRDILSICMVLKEKWKGEGGVKQTGAHAWKHFSLETNARKTTCMGTSVNLGTSLKWIGAG